MGKVINFLSVVVTALVFIFVAGLQNARASERDYQLEWCDRFNGEHEVVLPDRARVDCVLPEYAIEFDFGKKWAESVGQAVFYASQLDKHAGIVLIMESRKDCKYLSRLRETVAYGGLGITVWQVGEYAYQCSP